MKTKKKNILSRLWILISWFSSKSRWIIPVWVWALNYCKWYWTTISNIFPTGFKHVSFSRRSRSLHKILFRHVIFNVSTLNEFWENFDADRICRNRNWSSRAKNTQHSNDDDCLLLFCFLFRACRSPKSEWFIWNSNLFIVPRLNWWRNEQKTVKRSLVSYRFEGKAEKHFLSR